MAQRIHSYSEPLTTPAGAKYRVHAEGEVTELGSWHGWLVFEPEEGGAVPLRTDRETTQPEREDLLYWATGLEPVYLEGALGRAKPA